MAKKHRTEQKMYIGKDETMSVMANGGQVAIYVEHDLNRDEWVQDSVISADGVYKISGNGKWVKIVPSGGATFNI